MEFRDAVKTFRSQLGITQVELANALHINVATVHRWELGHNLPNRSAVSVLIEYASKSGATEDVIRFLGESSAVAAQGRLEKKNGRLFSIEHSSLSQLIEDASFPIYVCDYETDDLLYINHEAEKLLGGTLQQLKQKKCYECLMNRHSPCPFCRKEKLTAEHFTTFQSFLPSDHIFHLIQCKLIRWNGRKAQVRYIIDRGSAFDNTTESGREAAYTEQLHLRRELAGDAIAIAHFNLSRNSVIDVICDNAEYEKFLTIHPIDEIMRYMKDLAFTENDRITIEKICNRESMIRLFYTGKTSISYRHVTASMPGLYEATFNLMQNPVNFDIEVFVQLHDVTEDTMLKLISERLFHIDYDNIMTIDAETGEIHPYIGKCIQNVASAQNTFGYHIETFIEYLRKYCIDDDAEHVANEICLPNIKKQLADKEYYDTTFTTRRENQTVYKRVVFSYLSGAKKIILCAMQNLTDIHMLENEKRDFIAEELHTVMEKSNVNHHS